MKPSARSSRKTKKPARASDRLKEFWEGCTELEGKFLRDALLKEEWSLTATAAALGCPISTLQRACRRHPALTEERRQWSVSRWGSVRRAA